MISRVAASNYRCFRRLDVELPAYTVLVGANGSGKSALLDVPTYVGDMVARGVAEATAGDLRGDGPRAHRPRDVVYRGLGDRLSFLLETTPPPAVAARLSDDARRVGAQPPSRVRYEVHLRLRGETDLEVESERLELVSEGATRLVVGRDADVARLTAEYRRGVWATTALSPDQLALALTTDEGLFPGASSLRRALCGVVTYDPRAAAPRVSRSLELRPDAANLPWQVLHLQRTDAERYAEWLRVVQLALPCLREVDVVECRDRCAHLELWYNYDAPPSEPSSGVLRVLALTVVPYLESLPPAVLVECPESGVHPRAVHVVVDSLSALPDTQVLTTTCSPGVLSCTPLRRLVCLRRAADGSAEAVSGLEHPHVAGRGQEVDLGTLFAAGVLS